MGQFRDRNTGSVVSVADEDDSLMEKFGYYEPVQEKKTATKKAAAKKSSTSK